MDGLLGMFAKGNGADGGGGLMGMVRKFEGALADGQAAAAENVRLQQAIIAELIAINRTLLQLVKDKTDA